MRSTILLIFSAAVIALAHPSPAKAGGGGGGGGIGPCAATSSGANLRLQDYCIDGVAHFAEVGSSLVVTNEGQHSHSLTAADGSFDTGLLAPGESAEIDLGKPGIMTIYCKPHGTSEGHGMAGVLIVGDPDPAALASAGTGQDLSAALGEHDRATAQALTEHSQRLDTMEAELSRIQNSLRAAVSGLFGVLAVAAAIFLTLWRRRIIATEPSRRARPASATSD